MVILLVCALLAVPLPAQAARSEADLFAEAESRYLGGTYTAALEAYEAFLDAYPRSSLVPDAHYRRAVALLRLERWQEASDSLREVETRWRATRWIDYVPLWQGIALYHLDSWSLALASLDRFLAGTPDAARRVAAKISHYGRYSLLLFANGRNRTIAELGHAFEQRGAAPSRSRAPLAERGVVFHRRRQSCWR